MAIFDWQEEIRDLLSKDQSKRLELKERPDTGIYVKVYIRRDFGTSLREKAKIFIF